MKYILTIIQDTMVGYSAPRIFKNENVAKREFINAFKDDLNKDYMKIWLIGEFNSETGETKLLKSKELILGGDNIG